MKKIWDFIRKFWMSTLFIIGMLMYIAGLTQLGWLEGHSHWCEIVKKCGEILAISGVTSFFLRITQYNRIYQEALEEVIYSKKFLANRTDLQKIWENVSTSLFESRFPEVHAPLLDIIIKKYFPMDDNVSYYTDIKQHLLIKWKGEKRDNTIEIEEKIDLVVHTATDADTPYQTRHTVLTGNIVGATDYKRIINVMNYMIDDKSYKDQDIFKWTPEEGKLIFESKANLPKGKREYHVVQSVKRIQKLNYDDFLNYSARYLICNMDVEVEHPTDLKVSLYACGTVDQFKPMYERPDHKRWTYSGLILRKQGYVMTFNKQSTT